MRGKKHNPNDMTRDKVRELTGQGPTRIGGDLILDHQTFFQLAALRGRLEP